jgi:CheY-like chemotaxis protein
VKTVLVVDDEFGIVSVLEALLQDAGYRVVTAANGRKGLERLADSRPDVAVLDFMMPLMDGCAMARAMREHATWRDIPIIMMSAVTEPALRARFDGYDVFLRKPFRAEDLLAAVARLTA